MMCWAGVLGALLIFAGCGAAGPRANERVGDGPAALHYAVRVDDELSLLEVELCFRGGIAGGLIPGRSEASHRLRYARWLSPGPVRKLPAPAGRIAVPADVGEGCIGYGVSLQEGGSLSAIVRRSERDLLASPNAWLWRPLRRSPSLRAELTLGLPEGVTASLPWPLVGARYQLTAAAFAFDSHAAFGRFRPVEVEAQGVKASVALLGDLPRVDRQGLARWLRSSVHVAAQSDGQFPASLLQVVVVSEPSGGEPFGSVARGGGASVLMFVPQRYDAEMLRTDWVLPHELSHLLLPFVEREDAWLPEGLATYYQELLRARASIISPDAALENLAGAMRSASREGTGRPLCEESRAMHHTGAYRAVYWGGAAYWLMADVALRQRANRAQSLDTLLSTLRREARLTPPYRARELVDRLDRLSDTSVFSELAAGCELESFPDYEQSLHALGFRRGEPLHEAGQPLRDALFGAQLAK